MPERCILFVDDDSEVLMIYRKYMENKGYRTAGCADGSSALGFLAENKADCIVLDVMMPGEDGFSILPEIKKLSDAPVLFLSGRTKDQDRIKGLSLGADDYINKPCSLEELALRIEINIRRSRPESVNANVMEFPPLKILIAERKVFCGEKEIVLSNLEYDLLLLFAENAGTVLTYERIGVSIYGAYLVNDRQRVMMAVSRLRKKLEQYARTGNLIETVWGEGYRFGGQDNYHEKRV